jgi:hypothetical protein
MEDDICVTLFRVLLSFRLSMDKVTSPTASALDFWRQHYLCVIGITAKLITQPTTEYLPFLIKRRNGFCQKTSRFELRQHYLLHDFMIS